MNSIGLLTLLLAALGTGIVLGVFAIVMLGWPPPLVVFLGIVPLCLSMGMFFANHQRLG